MSGIFGGGGSGKSKTEASSEYPAEFKPLASSSVGKIQEAQRALPLSMFTGSQPMPIAGLSPFTTAGMNLVPFTGLTSPSEQQLFGLQQFWNDLINRTVGTLKPSEVAQSSINSLFRSAALRNETPKLPNIPSGPVPWMPPSSLPFSAFGPFAPVPLPSTEQSVPTVPITPLMPTTAVSPMLDNASIAAAVDAYNNELVPAPWDLRIKVTRAEANAWRANNGMVPAGGRLEERPQGEG